MTFTSREPLAGSVPWVGVTLKGPDEEAAEPGPGGAPEASAASASNPLAPPDAASLPVSSVLSFPDRDLAAAADLSPTAPLVARVNGTGSGPSFTIRNTSV